MPGTPVSFGSGTVPQIRDTEWALLVKLIIAENAAGGGGSSFQQVYHSTGNPNGVVLVNTDKPCMCIDTLNAVVWLKTDGVISSTGWVGP